MTYATLLMLAIAVLMYRHRQNPYRHTTLYWCIEDGKSSELYIHKCRHHDFAGGFTVDLFKRVTCVPDENYTSATSDWFDPWSGYSRKVLCYFEQVPYKEAQRLLAIQLPVTREVERQIAEAKLAGVLKPNQGFFGHSS